MTQALQGSAGKVQSLGFRIVAYSVRADISSDIQQVRPNPSQVSYRTITYWELSLYVRTCCAFHASIGIVLIRALYLGCDIEQTSIDLSIFE